MHVLTSKLLDRYPYSHYADPQTIQRGRAYYNQSRVLSVDLVTDREAICYVEGNSGEYTVSISVDNKSGALSFDCDCPYAVNHFCKHMVAAALELSETLKASEADEDEVEANHPPAVITVRPIEPSRQTTPNWQKKLDSVFIELPNPSRSGTNLQRYAAACLLLNKITFTNLCTPSSP